MFVSKHKKGNQNCHLPCLLPVRPLALPLALPLQRLPIALAERNVSVVHYRSSYRSGTINSDIRCPITSRLQINVARPFRCENNYKRLPSFRPTATFCWPQWLMMNLCVPPSRRTASALQYAYPELQADRDVVGAAVTQRMGGVRPDDQLTALLVRLHAGSTHDPTHMALEESSLKPCSECP